MTEKDKINDIAAPIPGEKVKPIDLLDFFPTSKIKAIKLSQYNIFTDLYVELNQKIDLRTSQKISVKKFKKNECLDIIKKNRNPQAFSLILKQNKNRILLDPLSIITPLQKVRKNTIDVRTLDIMIIGKTYPDIYILPLAPQQIVKKFYKQNHETIKK